MRTITRLTAAMVMALSVFSALAQTGASAGGQSQAVQETDREKAALAGLTPEQARFFMYFDVNRDGKITREEYRNAIVLFFEQMDRKHHGWVSDEEIRKAFPAVHANRPIDPKMRLSLTQFEDLMMHRFDVADSDHTGYLPPDQFVALQKTPE